jgi:hypothetical protein
MEELEKKECDFTEESQIEMEYVYFTVPGAGEIRLSRSTSFRTGGVEGFSFGVEWGEHGYAGGVLSKEEGVRLANFILRSINLDKLIED